MRKQRALGALIAVTALGAMAQPAFAGDLRISRDAQTNVTRLQFSEPQNPAYVPADPATGTPAQGTKFLAEVNNIAIVLEGDYFKVTDTATITAGKDCSAVSPGGASGTQGTTVWCRTVGTSGLGAVTKLQFDLGGSNDTYENKTSTPSDVQGGSGTDFIYNSGAGADLVRVNGNQSDDVFSCGAGADSVLVDGSDRLLTPSQGTGAHPADADTSCETVNGTLVNQPAPPPPPGATPVNPSPVGTPNPVSNAGLGVLPTAACSTPFIGTAGNDRIDGTAGGDREFGLAGNDYLRGQLGNDCLYGLAGKDTLIGDAGDDLLVGWSGDDLVYGGVGKDRLFGNSGVDKLYGDAGDDRLSGGLGNDRLSGGLGKDQLFGSFGNDQLFGGAGNDTLSGGLGKDTFSAGAGSDKINSRDGRREIVLCGLGTDTATADRLDVLIGCEVKIRR